MAGVTLLSLDKEISKAALRTESVPETDITVSNFAGLRKDHMEQTKEQRMKSLSPDGIARPVARYSHGIELPAGQRLIRTSGQLGMAVDGSVPSGARAQAEICFCNIQAILAEAEMSPCDVFHVTAYVTDRSHMAGYMAARDAFLDGVDILPASTLIIVSGFTRPEFVVEVEVSAAKS
jgi:enamine deaminase RidA (YjgF/YER057c/UK114 family)